jgi:Bacterial TniB protein
MNAVTEHFPHLDARMWNHASADAHTRIRLIEKDLFIDHGYSRYLSSLLQDYICAPRQTRMPCLLILGDAGMGKTAQIQKFQRQYPDDRDTQCGDLRRHIIVANVPPEPTQHNLYLSLLESLGAPSIARTRAVDHSGVARRMLTAMHTKIVVFDEIQHVCHARSRDKAVLLDTIKNISTVCQLSVICTGTPAVEREFLKDSQLERRFDMTRFVPWSVGAPLKRFLETYERARPLRLPSALGESSMMKAILEETGGVTHRIVQRLNAAAIVAVHERIERITPDLLCIKRLEPARVIAAKRAAAPGYDVVDRGGSAC